MQATIAHLSTDPARVIGGYVEARNPGSLIKWHCALAESFNASVKVELVHRTVYPTRESARKDIARYIEIRYSRKRLHSGFGYRTPQEVHDELLTLQAAA